jgi:hypothetical protein
MRRRHLLGAFALLGCAAAGYLPATPAVPAFDALASPTAADVGFDPARSPAAAPGPDGGIAARAAAEALERSAARRHARTRHPTAAPTPVRRLAARTTPPPPVPSAAASARRARRAVPHTAPGARQRSVSPRPAPIRARISPPPGSGTGRRVIYSVRRQRVWTVTTRGTVERTYLVSGRPSQPDPGRYRVYSRSRHATSAVSPPARMEYMIRFARGERTGVPIGFHDIPRLRDGRLEQTESQLGRPLSAGCIRQRPADAAYLWGFAPIGTPVVVLP